jgi:hypothetical protein
MKKDNTSYILIMDYMETLFRESTTEITREFLTDWIYETLNELNNLYLDRSAKEDRLQIWIVRLGVLHRMWKRVAAKQTS